MFTKILKNSIRKKRKIAMTVQRVINRILQEESLSTTNVYMYTNAQLQQSTCPHLACSTWMELIAGLNVGIVRKKVKGKATCWKQKLSSCKREEGVSKEGRQLWHWQWPSFSYTVGRASTFPRKNWMKWNCTRSCTRIRYVRPNRWNNGRIRRVWQRRR